MMKITDSLLVEHGILNKTLDFVSESMRQAKDLAAVKLLAGLLERLLHVHAEAEESLLLVALDHALEDKGQRIHLHQDHLEIDVRIKEVQSATELAKARNLLKGAVATTRKHFKYEEQVVFPRAEKVLSVETLQSLGKVLAEKRHCPHTDD